MRETSMLYNHSYIIVSEFLISKIVKTEIRKGSLGIHANFFPLFLTLQGNKFLSFLTEW